MKPDAGSSRREKLVVRIEADIRRYMESPRGRVTLGGRRRTARILRLRICARSPSSPMRSSPVCTGRARKKSARGWIATYWRG
jgi:hypothetical protein